MVDVKIFKELNGELYGATFDTKMQPTGRRAKHYVYPNENGFVHVTHYLIPKDEVPDDAIGLYATERVFFGKVRLVELVECHLPETWMAIGEIIKTFGNDLTMWTK